MSTVINFIKRIAPVIKRDRIAENLANLREQINVTILPALEAANRTFTKDSAAPENRKIAQTYASFAKGTIKGTLLNDLLLRYRKMPGILDSVEREVSKNFGSDVIAEAMDIRKANVVRLLNVVGFLNKFTMMLLNAYAHYDLQVSGLKMDYISDVTKGTAKRIEKYMPDYTLGLTGITSIEKFEQAMNNLPEMSADIEVFDGSEATKFDPFGIFNLNNFTADPAYWLATGLAQWQMNNYKDLVDKKELLEYRLLMLERARARESSPELERQIRERSSQVAALAEKIREHEESFA